MFLLDPASADLPSAVSGTVAPGSGAPQDLVFSASDLVAASECEYRTLRILDEKLGRSPKAQFPDDEMQRRAGTLGDQHEAKVLAGLIADYGHWDADRGAGVYSLERGANTRSDLLAKQAETELALRAGADVVFQATFFDGEFLGYADFIVNEGAGTGTPGRYEVWDTKLARHAKVGALLQLAAYGDQLIGMGLDPSPRVTLVLGAVVDGEYVRSHHSLPDLLPVFRERRDRFRELTAAHRERGSAVQWQQPGITYCGRCNYCAEQVQAHRDLLMVGGMTTLRRKKLIAEGITTIDALADLPPGRASGSVVRLRDQARMQLGRDTPDGSRTFTKDGEDHTVTFKVLPENALGSIPAPSPGDIFFDFEGDPLWQDPATSQWGLEYLFGVIEAPVCSAQTPQLTERLKPQASPCSVLSGRIPATKSGRLSWTSWPTWKNAAHVIRTCTSTTTPPTRNRPSGTCPCGIWPAKTSWTTGSAKVCWWISTPRPGTHSGSPSRRTPSRNSSRCTWAITSAPAR